MSRGKKKWLELCIKVPEKLREEFNLWLDDNECVGLIVKEIKSINDNVLVAYFNDDLAINEFERNLKLFLFDYGIETIYKIGYLEEKDWVGLFKEYFSPFVISDELRIICPWHKDRKDGDVIISPEMAFGTGRHETTQLCLYFIIDKKGCFRRVLDIGIGSGILAIASIKFGAEKVIAFDIDNDALKNCRRNVRLNKIPKGRIFIFCGTLSDLSKKVYLRKEEGFDLILCNMLPDNFYPFLNQVHNYLKRDSGRLIVSGIHINMVNKVREFLDKNHFKITSSKKLNDWIAYEVKSLKLNVKRLKLKG